MRGELLRTRAEKTALHTAQMETSQLRASHSERGGGRGQLQGSGSWVVRGRESRGNDGSICLPTFLVIGEQNLFHPLL